MAIEFLGHKQNLLAFIVQNVRPSARGAAPVIADLFCGTGAVSGALKANGFSVIANDSLVWCSKFAAALLLNDQEPEFNGVAQLLNTPTDGLFEKSRYDAVLDFLNRLPPRKGFIHNNYSPESRAHCPHERMYFTEANSGRIDAIRKQIADWTPHLTKGEEALLIRDLIRATNAVSNIAGTYGCYLKQWKSRAMQPLTLKPTQILDGKTAKHSVYCADANTLAPRLECQIVYADPPYTKRQYAAYYHILETIAIGDEPELIGSTGLRPWKDKSSPYCIKREASQALWDLVSKLDCGDFFLSYSEDGQIPDSEILRILREFGSVVRHEIRNRRYKSSVRPHRGNHLTERLYHLRFRS